GLYRAGSRRRWRADIVLRECAVAVAEHQAKGAVSDEGIQLPVPVEVADRGGLRETEARVGVRCRECVEGGCLCKRTSGNGERGQRKNSQQRQPCFLCEPDGYRV